MRSSLAIGFGAMLCGMAGLSAHAQTIYPINRAEILAGAKFDLKVEFPGSPARSGVRVTINGQDAAGVIGKTASFAEKEDGGEHSAYWIRDAAIGKPGTYVVEATAGERKTSVTWEVFGAGAAKAKNVILFIGDGLSVAHRTAARVLSKGLVEGRYGGDLAIDDMPNMALVSTSGFDALVTDSANSMSAYVTGHKSCVNAMGVYCARNKNNLAHPRVETIAEIVKRARGMSVGIITNTEIEDATPAAMVAHPRVETIAEIVKRTRGMSVGVITNTEIEDATPAAMVAHTRRRADYNDIVKMFFDVKPEVIMGGGTPNFLAKSLPGSKRADEDDYIKKFQAEGYTFVATNAELTASAGKSKLLGLFNPVNIDGALDRFFLKGGSVSQFPDQPDLTDQVKAALAILSKNENGFVLMVESGRIDKYSHSLDWERAVYDTIMLDNAVKLAKDFTAARNDTLIIVVGDHTHPVSVVGTYDDERPGQLIRDKMGTYAESKFPNYPAPNASGYPDRVDVSRRIAFAFGAFPDICDTGHPFMAGENVPAVPGAAKGTYAANEKNCDVQGAIRRTGNLPLDTPGGVHSADDVVLTATGPGADAFHGRIDNTRVFRIMATSLGLNMGVSQ